MAKKTTPYPRKSPSKHLGEKSRGKNDNLIFIISIVIAAFFWIMIKLADEYSVDYSFRVEYSNIPVEKRLTTIVDSTIDVGLTARGFTILRLNLFEDMDVLDINLDNFVIAKGDNNSYSVNTFELAERFKTLSGTQITDIAFSLTTLSFILEDLDQKEVRVESNLSLNFRQQFALYEEASITPDRVMMFGPKSVIDTIDIVSTRQIIINNIAENQQAVIGIENLYPDLLHFDPAEVRVDLRVERFTESSLEVPINFSRIDADIKSFPTTVTIFYTIAQKDFSNIQAGQFLVVPETQGIDLTTNDRLHLLLEKKPDFISNERIVPSDVEFLIIK